MNNNKKDTAYGTLENTNTIDKDEAILCLYKAVEKIHLGPGTISDFTLQSALYLLKYVSDRYLIPTITEHFGEVRGNTMKKLHQIDLKFEE
jgi:hypothetical protein